MTLHPTALAATPLLTLAHLPAFAEALGCTTGPMKRATAAPVALWR